MRNSSTDVEELKQIIMSKIKARSFDFEVVYKPSANDTYTFKVVIFSKPSRKKYKAHYAIPYQYTSANIRMLENSIDEQIEILKGL